jgi:hypothetical protein
MEMLNCLLNSLVNGTPEHAEKLYRAGVIEVLRRALEFQEPEAVLVALDALKALFDHGSLFQSKYGNLFVVDFEAQKGRTVLENLAGSINVVVHNSAIKLLNDYFNKEAN